MRWRAAHSKMQMAIRHFAVDIIFQSFALTSIDVGSSVFDPLKCAS